MVTPTISHIIFLPKFLGILDTEGKKIIIFQQTSVMLQRFNSTLFHESLVNWWNVAILACFIIFFLTPGIITTWGYIKIK